MLLNKDRTGVRVCLCLVYGKLWILLSWRALTEGQDTPIGPHDKQCARIISLLSALHIFTPQPTTLLWGENLERSKAELYWLRVIPASLAYRDSQVLIFWGDNWNVLLDFTTISLWEFSQPSWEQNTSDQRQNILMGSWLIIILI